MLIDVIVATITHKIVPRYKSIKMDSTSVSQSYKRTVVHLTVLYMMQTRFDKEVISKLLKLIYIPYNHWN